MSRRPAVSVFPGLLSALFESNDEVDYDTDIAPWIGDRVGVAAVPSGGDEPGVLAAIAYTDRDGAEAAMHRLQDSDEDGETFFAFSDKADYVLLGETQATVDAAAGTAQVLADAPAWTDAMKALDGDQIVTAGPTSVRSGTPSRRSSSRRLPRSTAWTAGSTSTARWCSVPARPATTWRSSGAPWT